MEINEEDFSYEGKAIESGNGKFEHFYEIIINNYKIQTTKQADEFIKEILQRKDKAGYWDAMMANEHWKKLQIKGTDWFVKIQENAAKYSKLIEISMTSDKIRLDDALEKILEEKK